MAKSIEKILVPTDGSESANGAARFAGVIARATGASIEVLFVREPPFYAAGYADVGLLELAGGAYVSQEDIDKAMNENVIKPAFAQATETLKPYTDQITTRVVDGQPARAICECAKKESTDLIVIGSRGRSAFAELTLGSVSSQVLHHAPCPVTVVR